MADVATFSMPRVSETGALAASQALPASVMLVAAAAPFERALPGSIFGFTLTTVELTIVIALATAAIAWLRGAAIEWRTPISLPLAALVGIAFVAAAAAPEFQGAAFRVAARLGVAVALFIVVANVAASGPAAKRIPAAARPAAKRIAATLLASAAIVGVIAVLELAQVPWVLNALKAFRPGFHVVGGQLRATSTLFYPTIASMLLEVAFALGLMWIATSRAAFAGLVLAGAGVIATFTRSGLITIALSLAIYGAVLFFRRRRWSGEHSRLALVAAVLVALVLTSRSPQMLVTRMSVEGSQDWYGATYDVPRQLTLEPDSFNDIAIGLSNDGRLTWQSDAMPPFALSYHFLQADTEDVLIFDGLRTPFTQPVKPGDAIQMKARVRAPGYPGTYVLIWDVVQEHRTWLSLEGVYPGRTTVAVEGTPVGAPLASQGRMPAGVMRMPRSVLWQAAIEIARERPVLGIGPDNFRHTYGRRLGLAAWDERVHANNSYIEVLAGMGVMGAAAMTWLMLGALRFARRSLIDASDARLPIVAASFAACAAIAVHALVDSFLTFTPTYAVFAIAAGLLFSVPSQKAGATC